MGEQLSLSVGSSCSPYAVFSSCVSHLMNDCPQDCKGRPYRYELHWPTGLSGKSRCLFVLANPSTASAAETDPTVNRCIGYAKRWGYAWCSVGNVRAWRATDPKDVPGDPAAIGKDNGDHLIQMVERSEIVVCGWGKLGGARGPVVLDLIRRLGKVPRTLKLNDDGSPAHPLYLRADLKPFSMEAV